MMSVAPANIDLKFALITSAWYNGYQRSYFHEKLNQQRVVRKKERRLPHPTALLRITPPSRAKSKLLSATLKNNREISAKSCLSSVRPTTARRGEVPDLRLLASGVSTGSVRPENPVYTNGRRPTIRPPPRPPTQLPNTVRWRGLAKAARIHFRAGLVRLVHRLLLPTRIPTARLHLA